MTRRVRVAAAVLTLALLASTLAAAPASSAFGAPETVASAAPVVSTARAGRTVRVGQLRLRRCAALPRALCGSVRRLWEPGRPRSGRVRIGFVLVPARVGLHRAVGTVVPHEGGPGYSTTGSGASYAAMYGPLLRQRNLLLVDQRGTGRSEPVRCPDLQNLVLDYHVAAGRCGRRLGARADDYATAWAADDVAAVVRLLRLGRVDLYGDSYGTFFSQVLAGRHPGLVRSVVLDGAYPTYGEDAFYPTQGPAMVRAHTAVCRRSAPCREGGDDFVSTLERVLDRVRARPWRGVSHDADGRRMRVRVDGASLVSVAYGATYAPAFSRELVAAMRAGLRGDRAPLLRLVAEATGGDTDLGDPAAYSEGLDAAVACHDYPQLYDMTEPSWRVRRQQYAAALTDRAKTHPRTYGPFTVREYADSDWQMLDWCLRWPVAPASNPAGPPRPPSGAYPDVPVLVLSGEMDSITTAAEGDLVAAQFPDARHVVVRNSFHVTALGDTDGCAERLVRVFVRTREVPGRLRACAERVPPVRALEAFPRRLSGVPSARGSGSEQGRRLVAAAALTAADLPDRWWSNYSGHGVGLRGGTWRYRGDRVVRFTLRGYRLVPGVPVGGTVRWDRERGRIQVRLRLPGHGRLSGAWSTRRPGAVAVLRGRLDGSVVRASLPAP